MDSDVIKARSQAIKVAIDVLREVCGDGCALGIGTGSTVSQFLEELSRTRYLSILGRSAVYCSSIDTCLKLSRYGIACRDILSIDSVDYLDLYIDSADEVDPRCFMIKGGGGALLREKVLTELSRRRLFIVDYAKLSDRIGTRSNLFIEVALAAYPLVLRRLHSMGYAAEPRLGVRRKGPVITDNGNMILEVGTGPMENPEEIDRRIKLIPGVVETGLFYPIHVSEIVVGYPTEARILHPR